jgi:hypothetical protein
MGNRKKSKDEKTFVHCIEPATGKPLCGRKGKVTDDPAAVTCLRCGKRAQAVLDRLAAEQEAREAEPHARQRAALAPLAQPRWWEKQEEGSDG